MNTFRYNWDSIPTVHQWNESISIEVVDNNIQYGYNPLIEYVPFMSIGSLMLYFIVFFKILTKIKNV